MKTPSGHPLEALARAVGGVVQGAGDVRITGVAAPDQAGPGSLVFLFDERHAAAIRASGAGAVVVAAARDDLPQPQLVVSHVRLAMARLLAVFAPAPPPSGRHPTVVVEAGAEVDATASLGPFVVVGAGSRVGPGAVLQAHVVIGRHVTVGAGCRLHPHVVVYDGVVLGDRVELHAGTVVGSDGFGYVADGQRRQVKVPQLGGVEVGADVELGALVAVDRGTLAATRLGRGTKVDNLVHIGHNAQIGEDVTIVGQAGLSGSVRIGDRATLAGQVGVAGHLSIGADALVLARAGVTKDVPPGACVSGFPAAPHGEERRRVAALRDLPRLRAALRALARRLDHSEGRAPS
ncbi:MAG: UDP-3-O-(3-hydroxymyristoyl)glucosamine N-acyltransferase [Candidatus Sericytochromatia bacterium]|nr:UDP-3-O-(3-hydroxymyristoyl)glucosamine N-acyltransferase [Candidatus Sericytochromatia bacterium]